MGSTFEVVLPLLDQNSAVNQSSTQPAAGVLA
jgi:hypothetical protein